MSYSGIIVGLGNPGQKYGGTRHNCGFMFIDRLLNASNAHVEELSGKKFHSLLWKFRLPFLENSWLAAEPQTFMNDSGAAVAPLLAFHNLQPDQLIVVQDELDIPPGELRFKFGGGLAGHNGLLSISQRIGSKDFYRLRIGIGKPADRGQVIDWVLGRPAPHDAQLISEAITEAVTVFGTYCQEGAHAAALQARSWKLRAAF